MNIQIIDFIIWTFIVFCLGVSFGVKSERKN